MNQEKLIASIEADLEKLENNLARERGLNLLIDLYARIRQLSPSQTKEALLKRHEMLERAVLNARILARSS
jgi:hypothetical protein